VFVFSPDRARLDSSGAFRNEVMCYFGDQGSIDRRQPQDPLARQSRREDQNRSDRVSEADAHRVHVVKTYLPFP
jgi:hypothetical protein